MQPAMISSTATREKTTLLNQAVAIKCNLQADSLERPSAQSKSVLFSVTSERTCEMNTGALHKGHPPFKLSGFSVVSWVETLLCIIPCHMDVCPCYTWVFPECAQHAVEYLRGTVLSRGVTKVDTKKNIFPHGLYWIKPPWYNYKESWWSVNFEILQNVSVQSTTHLTVVSLASKHHYCKLVERVISMPSMRA